MKFLGSLVIASILLAFVLQTAVMWVKAEIALAAHVKATWQQSEGVLVELCLRDKQGDVGAYNAVFIINGPSGRQVKAQIRVPRGYAGGKWGCVDVPSDFSGYHAQSPYSSKPRMFRWKVLVQGHEVVSGRFEYGDSGEAKALTLR